MKKHILKFILLFSVTGCAQQMYWTKENTPIPEIASDLHTCRTTSNIGEQKVFNAREIEYPCMVAKGYELSPKPPK